MKKIFALVTLALAGIFAASIPATAQLIYGNTFPFWTVNGPLVVTGTSTLSGGQVFTGSTSIGTAIVTPSTSFDLVNTTATTLNVGGAATTVTLGAATGTVTVGPAIVGSIATDSTTSTTGAIKTAGGIGVAKALNVGTTIGATGSITTAQFYSTAAPRTVTADGAVAATDSYIIANKAGTLSLTMPDPTAAINLGRRLCAKTSQAQTVVSAASNVVPLITAAAGTAILAATAGKWACAIADGTNWVIMEAN